MLRSNLNVVNARIKEYGQYGNDDDSKEDEDEWKPNHVFDVIRSTIKVVQKELTPRRSVPLNSCYDSRSFQLHPAVKSSEKWTQNNLNVNSFTVASGNNFKEENITSTTTGTRFCLIPLKTHQPKTTTSFTQTDEEPSIEDLEKLLSKLISKHQHHIEIILTNDKTKQKSKINVNNLKRNIESGDGNILNCLTSASVETQTDFTNNKNEVTTQTERTVTLAAAVQTLSDTRESSTQSDIIQQKCSEVQTVPVGFDVTEKVYTEPSDTREPICTPTNTFLFKNSSLLSSGPEAGVGKVVIPTELIKYFTKQHIFHTQSLTEQKLLSRILLFRCTAPIIQSSFLIPAKERNTYSFLEAPTCNNVPTTVTNTVETSASTSTEAQASCTNIDNSFINNTSAENFDISQLVNKDSFGFFSLDPVIMIAMFGFDPRGSPFNPCGYKLPTNLPDNLNSVELVKVRRDNITFDKDEDGLFTEVGQGSYGVVFSGRMKSTNNKIVIKDFFNDAVCWEFIKHEAQILTYLSGKGITPDFHGVLSSTINPTDYSLVQDFYGTANIEAILKILNPLPAKHWIHICVKISECLLKIHEHHILFNDLKSDNILIDLDGFNIRFIDFGMATFRHGLRHSGSPGNMAQFKFLAPEVRQGCHSTPQSDVFSLGFLFGQIMTLAKVVQLRPLWKSCTRVQAIKRPSVPEIIDILKAL